MEFPWHIDIVISGLDYSSTAPRALWSLALRLKAAPCGQRHRSKGSLGSWRCLDRCNRATASAVHMACSSSAAAGIACLGFHFSGPWSLLLSARHSGRGQLGKGKGGARPEVQPALACCRPWLGHGRRQGGAEGALANWPASFPSTQWVCPPRGQVLPMPMAVGRAGMQFLARGFPTSRGAR